MDYSKAMKKENEKLLSTAAAKDDENKALKIKLETAVTTAKKCETEIKSVRAKLSEETARSLTLEEENKKLKLNNDKVLKEKATILGKMINTTGLSDTIETKIETEMQDLKDDMRDFKDTVFDAINALKTQIEKSMTVTRLCPNQVSSEVQQRAETQEPAETTAIASGYQPVEITATEAERNQRSANSRPCKAFIVGDSVTQILSSRRLSDSDLQVKIKSHSGGHLQDLHNSITRMAETDSELICAADVILIHGGTNNLSDGVSAENLTEQLERIADIIENVNPESKIILSSVLPHKNDKLGNQLINQANQTLKQLCTRKSYCFLDNTERLTENGVPDTTLYRDNIHLNAKGGKVFGEAISRTIRDLLELPAQTSYVGEQDFQSGRLPGRREATKRNNGNNNQNHNNRNKNNRHNNKWNNNQNNNNQNNNHYNNNNQNNNSQNNNNWNNQNYWNNNSQNNNNGNNSNNWNGMMLMPMPFLPPWMQQQGNQMPMTNA